MSNGKEPSHLCATCEGKVVPGLCQSCVDYEPDREEDSGEEDSDTRAPIP